MTPRTPPNLFDEQHPTGAARGIAWEDVACPLCGADHSEARFEAADTTPASLDPESLAGRKLRFLVVRCQTCGLHYTNPRPDPTAIGRFYPTDYKPHRNTNAPARATKPRTHPLERLLGRPCHERRGQLPWPGTGRLLDFGCGGGSFLKRMADLGWDVVGVDSAAGVVHRVRDELGLLAIEGSLPHVDLRPCSFEVVTMWHSLEHTHDPCAILREAYRLLVPGGKLIVATPNIDSWSFRRFGPAWYGLDLPRHLTHFTPETLTVALQSAGLRVSNVRPLRHSRWLRSSARLAKGNLSWSGWSDRMLTWKAVAKVAAWLTYMFDQSDCMLAVAERPG